MEKSFVESRHNVNLYRGNLTSCVLGDKIGGWVEMAIFYRIDYTMIVLIKMNAETCYHSSREF